MKEKTKPI
jgi:hypothetical protein